MIVNKQLDITGEDLAFAASTFDEQGGPAVAFTLTDQGSGTILCPDDQQRSGRFAIPTTGDHLGRQPAVGSEYQFADSQRWTNHR